MSVWGNRSYENFFSYSNASILFRVRLWVIIKKTTSTDKCTLVRVRPIVLQALKLLWSTFANRKAFRMVNYHALKVQFNSQIEKLFDFDPSHETTMKIANLNKLKKMYFSLEME